MKLSIAITRGSSPVVVSGGTLRGLMIVGAALALGCGSQTESVPGSESLEFQRLRNGDVTLIRDDSTYLLRRNNWSFYAWVDAAARSKAGRSESDRVTPLTIIHFDSHSDMRHAPVCAEPDSVRAGDLAALQNYVAELAISAFLLPAMHYGFVKEVYWVQPEISCFSGPPSSIRFSLEERDGRLRPRVRNGANPVSVSASAVAAHQGEPVSRASELENTYGFASDDWIGDQFTIHCLSRKQLEERVADGALAGSRVAIDLDLDYFGTSGAPRGYGYLAFSPNSQVAVGILGGTLPVFYMGRDSRSAELDAVVGLIGELDPESIAICESPDHSHRDTLPKLSQKAMARLRSSGDRANLDGESEGMQHPIVSVLGPEGDTRLDPACIQRVDIGEADSLRLELSWTVAIGIETEISVFFDPAGARDRVIARWRYNGHSDRVILATPVPRGSSQHLRGGWEVEVRRVIDGGLLHCSAFSLDASERRLRATIDQLRERGAKIPEASEFYESRTPSELVEWGRSGGLPVGWVHRLILAHPRFHEFQCENLSRHRETVGTIATVP